MAEEYQRIDPLKDLLKVSSTLEPVPRKEDVAEQNQQSMALLKGMMSKAA